VKVLGQKRNDGLEARKKKNEDIVKIAFTPDRDLDDYLRSKNLLDEKEIKVKKDDCKSKVEEKERALNIATLLSWRPEQHQPEITTTSESTDSLSNSLEHEMSEKEGQSPGDADKKYFDLVHNNSMTEGEIESAYEDLCAEINKEYTADKGKDCFWPNALQSKFSKIKKIDREFSKTKQQEERTREKEFLDMEEQKDVEWRKVEVAKGEFSKMEKQREKGKSTGTVEFSMMTEQQEERKLTTTVEEFSRMEEHEEEEWSPLSPAEQWVGVVVEEVGPLFSRPFSPRIRGWVAPDPRNHCSAKRDLNCQALDDPLTNPVAEKPPLPLTSPPTQRLTTQKLSTHLKAPIFSKPQKTSSENNKQTTTTIQFEEENQKRDFTDNQVPLFKRPFSPEAVLQWSSEVKRRDSIGRGGF